MRSKQRLSVIYTAVSLLIAVSVFILFSYGGNNPREFWQHTFWFIALGHGLYVFIALSTTISPKALWQRSKGVTMEVFRSNWKYGRFATTGMAVTWLQNQSVTPMLMLMFGPLVVGYYQIARMIITPINMINVGLQKSALPQIRRIYGDGNGEALESAIDGHMRVSMKVVAIYVATLIVIGVFAMLFGVGSNWHVLAPMFISAIVVTALSNYRFWFSQRFVVRMKFVVLLKVGVVASTLAILTMLFTGYGLKNAYLVILGSAIGEIYMVIMLKRRMSTELK